VSRTLTPERQALRQDAIRIREELGWSVRDIAGHLSLPKTDIHRWVSHISQPALSHNAAPLELNKVHIMDAVHGMYRLPHDSVDLIFADPPYNLGVNYFNGHSDRLKNYLATCQQWFMAMYRVMRNTGSLTTQSFPISTG